LTVPDEDRRKEMKPLYLQSGGKVGGPFDFEQIRSGVRQGKLTPAHEASVDGQAWFRLETIWRDLVDDASAAASPAKPSASLPIEAESRSSPPPSVSPSHADPPVVPRAPKLEKLTASPPPLPDEPVFVDAGPYAGVESGPEFSSPTAGFGPSSRKNAPVRIGPIDDSSAPVEESASDGPAPYAPAYAENLFGILRVASFCAGLAYLAVFLMPLYAIVTVFNKSAYSDNLQLGTIIYGALVPAAFLLDLATSAVLLVWLNNVFQRLRVFQRRLASESFGSRVFSYFVPVMSAFTFAEFLGRVWNAANARNRTKGMRVSKPGVVVFGTTMRCVVWISYFAVALAFKWTVSINDEISEFRSDGRNSARYQQVRVAQERNLQVAKLEQRMATSGMVLLGAMALTGAASAAVMFSILTYASEVHQDMMVIQDSSDSA
jgi:hypothetical protein